MAKKKKMGLFESINNPGTFIYKWLSHGSHWSDFSVEQLTEDGKRSSLTVWDIDHADYKRFAKNDQEMPGRTDGDDMFDGGDSQDRFFGSKGNDEVRGGDGHDLLIGGDGYDELWGGHGHDLLIGGRGNDNLSGGRGNDWLTGDMGNDSLHGDGGADWLYGGDGDDTLHGGKGSDELHGGDGNDELWGGAGANEFVFYKSETGNDTIKDFEDGTDMLDFRHHLDFDDLTITRGDDGTVVSWEDEHGVQSSITIEGNAVITEVDFLFL